MKAQCDYLTLILPFTGKEKEQIRETDGDVNILFINQDYLTYHLRKILGQPFKESSLGFFQSYDFNSEIFIIKRKSYEVHFRGKFFLREGFELFSSVYKAMLGLGYSPHISRLDVCFTGEWEFQDLAKTILRSNFKGLEVDTKKRKKLITYIKAHNVRFDILCYSKTSQLRRLKDKEYVESFRKRYGTDENISRIEVRLHNRHSLESFTLLLNQGEAAFFRKIPRLIVPHILARLKPTRRVLKALTDASLA
jgi:hypothetical protein